MKFLANIVTSILLIFVFTSCDNTERLENKENQQSLFIGAWKFISLKAESSDGDIRYPFGENPTGKLIYESKEHMSFLLMRPNRPKFVSGDIFNSTYEELKYAFENFDAYCGTYKVDTKKKIITHKIEACRFPNWEGKNQVRFYEFKNDTLFLSGSISAMEKEWDLKATLIKL
jgi:hypothetical protein